MQVSELCLRIELSTRVNRTAAVSAADVASCLASFMCLTMHKMPMVAENRIQGWLQLACHRSNLLGMILHHVVGGSTASCAPGHDAQLKNARFCQVEGQRKLPCHT